MSPLRWRRTLRLGPLRWNFTQSGFSSWSLRVGPWSWNSRSQAHRVDLPGALHYVSGRRPQRRAAGGRDGAR